MESGPQQSGIDSLHGASLLSTVLFVAVAAMVVMGALWLLPVLGTPQMVLPGAGRMALVVMVLGFAVALVSTLLDPPNTMRRTLEVLFAAALLCSEYVALVAWFTVSGASSC
jgi:hypothetical protein